MSAAGRAESPRAGDPRGGARTPPAVGGVSPVEGAGEGDRSRSAGRIVRYRGEAGWDGVDVLAYRLGEGPAGHDGVTRRVLAAPAAAAFDVRYFEVEPGGRTSHESHAHVHVVIVLRGRGRVRLGSSDEAVGFGDVVHVAPDEPHQFLNPFDEPFGFVCIVDRDRDRPVAAGG